MSMKIAIVDHDSLSSESFVSLLNTYAQSNHRLLDIHTFDNGLFFLKNFCADYDVVFMDVSLPDVDGLEIARRMRLIDDSVILIMVSDLAKYAIKAFDVEAFDYFVRPVSYDHLTKKMNRIFTLMNKHNKEQKIVIKTTEGNKIIDSDRIRYLEIMDHRVYFHTEDGIFDFYGSLSSVEKLLPGDRFIRCNHCYIVNLDYVTKIEKFEVCLGKDTLQISHPKKKQFMKAFSDYMGKLSV